jgi:aminopeptidase
MKQKGIFFLLVFVTFVALTFSGYTQETPPGQPDYDAIAHKIVNYALEVKPGEVVIISGAPAELDLLGALVVAVYKAGGQPTVEIDIPKANKRAVMEMPIEYLKITPMYQLMKVRNADCFIYTGSVQDPKLFSDVPEERMAAYRYAFMPLNDAINRAHFRSVSLGQTGGIPTKAYAESKGANYEDMLGMFWKSVNADYNQMLVTGQTISKMLEPNSEIKLTSQAGTNLTFRISNIPARINCGRCVENISAFGPAQTWLPAGEIYACVDPSSASGTMVIPSMTFRGNVIKNLKLTFTNGRITDLKADENGELISKNLEMSTGDKDVFSIIDIGINPNSQPLQGSDYYSWEMAGMVTATIGSNSWAGGNVESDNSLFFHLTNATLSIDGKTIVSNGQLKVP